MGFFSGLLSLLSGGTAYKLSDQLLFDKVIGFRGIVEGVGCSTLVQNVAVALADTTRYKIAVIDTNMLYPCMADMLKVDDNARDDNKDIYDFNSGTAIGKIAKDTNYNNVTLFRFYKRGIIDMVSLADDISLSDKLLNELKQFYDIILIDLSHEPTQFATEAAVKCNKIFLVADTSIKCSANILYSLNYMTTLGVSLTKCKKVILNKTTNVNAGVKGVLSDMGISVIGEIPFSQLIYNSGVTGKPFYGLATRDSVITDAHVVIQTLIDDITEKTPLNEKYIKDSTSNGDSTLNGDNVVDDNASSVSVGGKHSKSRGSKQDNSSKVSGNSGVEHESSDTVTSDVDRVRGILGSDVCIEPNPIPTTSDDVDIDFSDGEDDSIDGTDDFAEPTFIGRGR